MTVFLLALALLVGASGAAEAGPVAPLFTAVSGWFTATFGAAVGGFLVNTLGSMVLSALSMALRKKPKVTQAGITTETTTSGGTVPQRLIFGRYATAGQHVCPPMTYETDDDPNEYMVYVIALADKPITGLVRLFIDGTPVEFNGNPAASANGDTAGVTVIDPPDIEYSDKFWIRFHDGTQTSADAYLRRVAGTYPERPWLGDMIGTGTAYVVVTFRGKGEERTYKGFPNVKFEIDGHRLRDPRTGTDVFTRNPDVIAYNILRGITMPDGQVWGVGATRYIMPHIIAAANLCDSAVPVASGGTRPRYQAGLEISVEDEPHEALMEIVKAMGGDVADMGGTWTLKAGENGGPVYAFTDDDVIVTDSRSLRPYPPLNETVNAIHASFPDPAKQWEASEAVPLYNAAYEAADGGRRLIADVSFPAVPYAMQVRALMREMLADHRKHRTHVITLPPDALGVNLGEMIAWTSEINGYIAKLFKVVAKRVDPQSLCVALTITEHDPADYDYDPDSDGLLPVIPSPRPVTPVVVGVPGFAATAVIVPGDNGSRPGIRMAWNPDVDARSVFWEIYRVAGNTLVASGIERPAAGEKVVTEGLVRATNYAVRGQLVIPGRVTDPTPWVYVTTEDIRLGWDDLSTEINTTITGWQTWADGTGAYLRDIMDELGVVQDEVIEGDFGAFTERSELRASIQGVQVSLGEQSATTASAIDALIVRVGEVEGGTTALSEAITLVEAKTDRSSAEGLLRVTAEATPAGSQSRIGIRAEASEGDASHSAAIFVEAKSDGTSQVGVVANRFFIASSDAPGAAWMAPFIVDAGVTYINNARIRNLSVENIEDGAVTNFGVAGSGAQIISTANHLVCSTAVPVGAYSARLLISYDLMLDGLSSTWGSAQVRIFINGVVAYQTTISKYSGEYIGMTFGKLATAANGNGEIVAELRIAGASGQSIQFSNFTVSTFRR